MRKLKNPVQLAGELKTALEQRGLVTETQIAMACGLNQSQVHRNLYGRPKRVSRTLVALCKYADIDAYEDAGNPSESAVLMRALADVWDGTEPHARKLAKLLLAHHQARV